MNFSRCQAWFCSPTALPFDLPYGFMEKFLAAICAGIAIDVLQCFTANCF
jgi:hypothetical protein